MILWLKFKLVATAAAFCACAGIAVFAFGADRTAPEQPPPPAAGGAVSDEQPNDWEVNPFEGTQSISVKYGARTIEIDKPEDVQALLAKLRIIAIENGTHLLAMQTVTLVCHRGEKKGDYTARSDDRGVLMVQTGLIYIGKRFFTALNQQLAKSGETVNVLEYPKIGAAPPSGEKLGVEDLSRGFTAGSLNYKVAGEYRTIQIAGDKDLAELSKAFQVLNTGPRQKDIFAKSYFSLKTKNGQTFMGDFIAADTVNSSLGALTVAPALAQTFAGLAGKAEGRAIDLLADNPAGDTEQAASAKADAVLGDIVEIKVLTYRGKTFDLAMPREEVAKIMAAWKPCRVWNLKGGTPSSGCKLEVKTKAGATHTLTFLDSSKFPGAIYDFQPVDVSGLGVVWVAHMWRQWAEVAAGKMEGDAETLLQGRIAARALKDLPSFLGKTVNLRIEYSDGKDWLIESVTDSSAKKQLLALLTVAAVHEDKGVKPPKQPAAVLHVVPGAGFDLSFVFTAERTAVVPGWGTVEFKNDVAGPITRLGTDAPAQKRLEDDF
jgi:hypothetical protein